MKIDKSYGGKFYRQCTHEEKLRFEQHHKKRSDRKEQKYALMELSDNDPRVQQGKSIAAYWEQTIKEATPAKKATGAGTGILPNDFFNPPEPEPQGSPDL